MKIFIVATTLVFLIQYGDCLRCYTCLFPTLSPIDCIKFPVRCPPNQRCLYSTATGKTKNFPFILHEMSCAVNSLCGISGEKSTLGINVTYHNTCCDTDLCNSAAKSSLSIALLLPPLLLLF
ncbi:lymphocyte antigen 6 complex locus protein G6c [Bufo bufo]|uniref:lymphocyte antigen 6 complex locus protein G6c n=1 Tax=Bufo bufo TaxID=8384 RepID=UPI001ABE911A|nr:lymphocyte antigen 6 complex locus protein G6c [Bufo bufo]